MITHLEKELEEVKEKIFKMVDLSIEAISESVESLKKSDSELARAVIDKDNLLDRLEVEIDNECVKILVTRQPAAVHLRFVLVMLKINTDLERIGDLATNIARETIKLKGKKTFKALIGIPRMAEISSEMIKDAINAMVVMDPEIARKVIERDDEIDNLNIQIFRELFTYMAEDISIISDALGLIMVARALERIGDHATNIAERVIYYIDGVDIRHSE